MAPFWLPIITALIASTSALAGVMLNNYLARKDKRLELSFRAGQEAKDFLISRGEELYVHLDQMDAYVAGHCRLIQSFCASAITFDEFRSARRDSLGDRERFSVSRIKLSIRSFFPSLAPVYNELAENLGRIDIIDHALLEARQHDASLLVRANADAIRLQRLVTTKGEQLRDALAGLLASTFAARSMAQPPATADNRSAGSP
jgi:hypothetical protein